MFTFVAKRTTDKVIRGKRFKFVKGERFPITREGLKLSDGPPSLYREKMAVVTPR